MGSSSEANGAFTSEYAERKQWKLDEGLLKALALVIPDRLRDSYDAADDLDDEGPLPPAVYDLGAGRGAYVAWLRERGNPYALGFDGIDNIESMTDRLVVQADLSKPYFGHARQDGRKIGPGHWAMSIEVGEHIPRANESAFLDNVAAAATMGLVISWAVPGQRGRNHINCRLPEYIACELGVRGWQLNHQMTEEARKAAGKGWDRKLMVFQPLE